MLPLTALWGVPLPWPRGPRSGLALLLAHLSSHVAIESPTRLSPRFMALEPCGFVPFTVSPQLRRPSPAGLTRPRALSGPLGLYTPALMSRFLPRRPLGLADAVR